MSGDASAGPKSPPLNCEQPPRPPRNPEGPSQDGADRSLTQEQLGAPQQGQAGDHGLVVLAAQVALVDGLPRGCRGLLWSPSGPLLPPVFLPFLLG